MNSKLLALCLAGFSLVPDFCSLQREGAGATVAYTEPLSFYWQALGALRQAHWMGHLTSGYLSPLVFRFWEGKPPQEVPRKGRILFLHPNLLP